MIIWSLITSIQWSEFTEIFYMFHFLVYFILPECVTLLMIKLDVLLKIMQNLDPMLVLGVVTLSMGRKYLGNPHAVIGILGDAPFPLPIGIVEESIISYIYGKDKFFILLDSLYRLLCLLSRFL